MSFRSKTLSLLTLAAFSASVAACSSPSVSTDPMLEGMDQVDALAKKAEAPAIAGEFIVKYKAGKNAMNAFSADGGKVVKELGGKNKSGMYVVQMPATNSSSDTLAKLKSDPNVEWAEPNRIMKVELPKFFQDILDKLTGGKADSFPNDPMFKDQYAHKVTQAQEGWALLKSNPEITVAIVDTGVDKNHPDLKGRMVAGYSAYPGEDAGKDMQGHGTHCAGIAAAVSNNGVGVTGAAALGNVKIQPVKVLNDQGSGSYAAVADGIAWAASNGAKVISMSLGGPSSSQAITDAVKLALKNDIVVVAAMGNSGPNAGPSYPAAVEGVMGVAATDSADKIASFSQTGKHNSVAAPGVNILSTFPTYQNGIGQTNYGKISGTSMACPYVSGVATLVRAYNPTLKAADVRSLIEKNADDLGAAGWDKTFGHGRVNVFKTVKAALGSK
jgi:thermitase